MPRKNTLNLWTVVQHSGYGYNKDYQFQRGLESRQLEKQSEATLVRKEGGQLFDDYMAVEDYCMAEMYPEDCVGFTPQAPGRFSMKAIDGLRIYLSQR